MICRRRATPGFQPPGLRRRVGQRLIPSVQVAGNGGVTLIVYSTDAGSIGCANVDAAARTSALALHGDHFLRLLRVEGDLAICRIE